MPYTPKSKFDLPKDAPEYLKGVMTQLRNELKNISSAVASSTGSALVVVYPGIDSSNSGATVISSSSNVKSGTSSVTSATEKFIEFASPFSVEPNVTLCAIAGVDGSFGLVNPQNLSVTVEGFLIKANDVLQDGTVFYIASSKS